MQPDIGLFFQAKQLHFRGRTLLCMDSHRPRASMYKKKIARAHFQCAPFTPEKTVYNYRYLASLNLIFHFVPKPVDL